MIPYSTQNISEADIRAVVKVIKSRWLTQGPMIERFERSLANFLGAKFAVTFSSGTAALHGAYAAAGIGRGDEVIVPALTFAATANAAIYLGARPVFADVDPDTGLMDIRDATKKITKRTKAIVPVDYSGRAVDIDAYRALAKKYKLLLIEDGAQSLGATYEGRLVGTQADMTMFSFHPVKSITTGEGGAIVTNNKNFYEYMKMFRTHGITKDTKRLKNKKNAEWHQEMQILGNNYRMTDIQAALGDSQIRKLPRFIAKRRIAARKYIPLLKNIPGVTLPDLSALDSSAWHLFVIHVDLRARDRVFKALRAAGIGVQVHYLPVYLHPYYRDLGYKAGLCPKTEEFSSSAISIPLFPEITKEQQDYVAKTLRDIMSSL
jgi:perosamine synthetase